MPGVGTHLVCVRTWKARFDRGTQVAGKKRVRRHTRAGWRWRAGSDGKDRQIGFGRDGGRCGLWGLESIIQGERSSGDASVSVWGAGDRFHYCEGAGCCSRSVDRARQCNCSDGVRRLCACALRNLCLRAPRRWRGRGGPDCPCSTRVSKRTSASLAAGLRRRCAVCAGVTRSAGASFRGSTFSFFRCSQARACRQK